MHQWGSQIPAPTKNWKHFFHGTSTGFTVSLRITSEVGWIADSDLNVYHEAAVSPDGSPCKIDLNDWADEHYGGYTNNMGQHILDQAYMDIRIEHRDPAGTWNHNFKVAYLGIIGGRLLECPEPRGHSGRRRHHLQRRR